MPAENEAPKDRMQWSTPDIERSRRDQDRAAFAALFEYFAPRIKAFLQRSGASEASAEELAQETMLAVWRKAALFDPESAGAAAWIFTMARNLRIDAHRRSSRGGVIETSDVEIEFQIETHRCPTPVWLRRSPRSGSGRHFRSCLLTRYASSSCPSSRRRHTRTSRKLWRFHWERSNQGCAWPWAGFAIC